MDKQDEQNDIQNMTSRNQPGEGRRAPSIIRASNISGRTIVTYGNPRDNVIWTRSHQQTPQPDVIPSIEEDEPEDPSEEQPELCIPYQPQPASPRISLNHHTLEDIFVAAGRMARSREDAIHPQDLQVVAIDGSETRAVTFVEWAREIEEKTNCTIQDLVVVQAAHYEEVLSAYEAQVKRLEAENKRLKERP